MNSLSPHNIIAQIYADLTGYVGSALAVPEFTDHISAKQFRK